MPSYAYRLQEPKHLLGKMERELHRALKDEKWASDHAYNFAVTAWHMTDWLWRQAEVSEPSKRNHFGCRSLQTFQNFIRRESGALDICSDLANGAKHFVVSRRKKAVLGAEVSTKVVEGGTLGSFVLGSDRLGGTIPVLKVRLANGTSRLVEAIFKEAVSFWYKFFRSHDLFPPHARRKYPRHETRKRGRVGDA